MNSILIRLFNLMPKYMENKNIINKKAREVFLKSNSKNEFFLIHGYTGSPTDFNQLGFYLHKRFNVNVRIIRLKGHGEVIDNIDKLNYNDFIFNVENELIKDIKKGRNIVLVGMSVGSLITLDLASKYPVKGIINVSTPYKHKFVTKLISLFEPLIIKKHWSKPIPEYEKVMRKDAFFYDVNIRGFKVIKQGKKILSKNLKKITIPCLFIHVKKDHIFHYKGAEVIRKKISSKITDVLLFETYGNSSHNPFYTEGHIKLYKMIGDFVHKNRLFD